mmetsp:Transcript_14462/g.14520  ORF Transcript_14462/g.14520 Transcript_14462/m.14520 type:complete len:589 (+) Transcript_14462:2-1768(+)
MEEDKSSSSSSSLEDVEESQLDPEEAKDKVADEPATLIRHPQRKYGSFISQHNHPEIPELLHQKSDIKMSKKGVNVFVRFRPDNATEEKLGVQCVDFHPDQKAVSVSCDGISHGFNFRRIFPPESSQEQIFLSCALPLVESILEGYNCAILAYGQTGAGKTYSLLGPGYDHPERVGKCDQELRGVAPRLLQSIFHQIYSTVSGEAVYKVYTSYIQIYNEKIFDLLNPAKEKLKVYQDTDKGLWITDATKVPSKNVKEVNQILELGTKYRVTAATNSNAESSRSHALLILTITKHLVNTGTYRASQVYMVDLCGSERISKTGVVEERLKEAQNINKSLLSLGNVINALAEKRKHIPYRDSKMTRLLQNSFGGNSLTSLLLCCSSNSTNALETISTLRFGDRANMVHNRPVINQRESADDLRRLLTESNVKLINQQKVIRYQNERIIEMETIIRELFSMMGQSQVRAVQRKIQIPLAPMSRNPFDKLGVNTFVCIFSFLHPADVLSMVGVCKSFHQRLKCENLWRYFLIELKQGRMGFKFISVDNWDINFDRIDSYWDAFKDKFIKSLEKGMPADPESSSRGIHLFRNIR